jgi:DNA ligase-associated metallophosphoesterase
MNQGFREIYVRGEKLLLCHEKCLVWPAQKLIVVADLHLGKSETFQMSGLWLPAGAQHEDLQLIFQIARKFALRDIVFLGDLVHSKRGITAALASTFSQWLTTWQQEFTGNIFVTVGNHDQSLLQAWPKNWALAKTVENLALGPFVFQHEPPDPAQLQEDRFYWVGHVHPVTVLQHGPDRLRLPCFVVDAKTGYLPAFSSLAGGFQMNLAANRKIFALGAGRVFEVQGSDRHMRI